jgi:putative mRNA 3-end processing factor
VLAPPSSAGSGWLRRFPEPSDAFASGWMQVRGARRRRGVDRGFVLSDHADWPGLQWAIAQTQAQRVLVTHGQVEPMVRWLRERGLQADPLATRFGEGTDEDDAGAAGASGAADAADVSGENAAHLDSEPPAVRQD